MDSHFFDDRNAAIKEFINKDTKVKFMMKFKYKDKDSDYETIAVIDHSEIKQDDDGPFLSLMYYLNGGMLRSYMSLKKYKFFAPIDIPTWDVNEKENIIELCYSHSLELYNNMDLGDSIGVPVIGRYDLERKYMWFYRMQPPFTPKLFV